MRIKRLSSWKKSFHLTSDKSVGSFDVLIRRPFLSLMFFRARLTDKVFNVLENNNILATKVPLNMTHLF